jgi:hypothetical protein
VVKQSSVLVSFAAICNVSHTFAQSPQFGGSLQSLVSKAVQAEWRRLSDAEMTCIEQPLWQQRSAISASTDRNIAPSDSRIAAERAFVKIK